MRTEDGLKERRSTAEGLRRWCLGRATAIIEALLRQEGQWHAPAVGEEHVLRAGPGLRGVRERAEGGAGGEEGAGRREVADGDGAADNGGAAPPEGGRAEIQYETGGLGLMERSGSLVLLTEKGEAYGKNDRARKVPLYREDRAELLLKAAGFPKIEKK